MSDASTRAGTLLVDIGNTRVKWARLVDGKLGRQHAAAHTGWTSADFARALFGNQQGRAARARQSERAGSRAVTPERRGPLARRGALERILVVSVAGTGVDRLVAAAANDQIGIPPEFFQSTRRAGGVTTQYSEPWRLGADRLVGAIGAHHLSRGRAVCVIGVGTALTLDLVDDRGRHRGGAIVPAPRLMKDSLLNKTSGIRRRAQGGSASAGNLFARSTRAAIEQGSRYAAAAVIDRAVIEARKVIGRRPLVLLTGGGAPALRPLLNTRHRFVPDLVLQGLAVLAQESTRSRAPRTRP